MSVGTEDIEGIASVLNGNLKEAIPTSDSTSVKSGNRWILNFVCNVLLCVFQILLNNLHLKMS